MSSLLYRLGRVSFRARWKVVLVWLVVLLTAAGLARGFGGYFDDTFEIPGAPSQVAIDQLKMTFPQAADLSATMLVIPPSGTTMNSNEVRSEIEDAIVNLEEIPWVTGVQSPYNEHLSGAITPAGDAGLVTIRTEGTISTFSDEQRTVLNDHGERLEAELPGAQVHLGGEAYSVLKPSIGITEVYGLVVALVVLLLVLGSLFAAVMPLVSGLAGSALSLLVIIVAAGQMSINSTTALLALMLSLAVGVDYSLFIVSRHRDQLATGMDAEESTARAIATSGSAVVFAGVTVVIALVGMMVAQIPFLTVMGLFSALSVAIEVALALTLLPAMLGIAGEKLRPRKQRSAGRVARGWIRAVTRLPILTVAVIAVALGVLAMPAANMHLALPNSATHPPTSQDRVTYDLVSQKFGPGQNGPLILMMNILEVDDPMQLREDLVADVEGIPGVARVPMAAPNPGLDTMMLQVIPTTSPDDPATAALVERLRDQAPRWQGEYGVDVSVTGLTAINLDVSQRLAGAMLPFGLVVVGLSFTLLTLVFRSIWVPIKAALGYVLSVAAAFGATTLVFNHGWFGSLINLANPIPIISFLPILLMGILFGLAMDYEVFLTSRMREEFVHGNRTTFIEEGFSHSARVVTAAAVIMFAVFVFFVPSSDGPIKPIAFSLAVGVAVDAFLIRMAFGPAVMRMLGHHAWWLPRWLDARMPGVDVEGNALEHQLRLANWPSPEDHHLIYAEGLRVESGPDSALAGMCLAVSPGEVLAVAGDLASRRALLLGLGGRLVFTGGQAKVLGHVLPEEAPAVRRLVGYTSTTSANFNRHLSRPGTPILIVDDAHQLLPEQAQQLAARREELTSVGGALILGVPAGIEPATLGPVGSGTRLVNLPDRFKVEGAH